MDVYPANLLTGHQLHVAVIACLYKNHDATLEVFQKRQNKESRAYRLFIHRSDSTAGVSIMANVACTVQDS